ncbi:MAG: diaminopimelate decarboxylase [Rothia sp. (in: high G+C Gram-positive bacteria)]|nr:diaminopimelate decarboxylase [Rothia sp. (in: high G+C Gram-positive bacteria)]
MAAESNLYQPDWLKKPEDPALLDPKIWPKNFSRDQKTGQLCVDGQPVSQLVQDFKTPQYVLSQTAFKTRAQEFKEAFEEAFARYGAQVSVYYAGKAFLCTALARWVGQQGLKLDTASGGELAIAIRAGLAGQDIALHGNNKSAAEIRRALEYGVGRIVADSVAEIKLIAHVAADMGKVAPVLLRLTPGVHAATHSYIATAHEDQKFGQSLLPGSASLAGLSPEELTRLKLTSQDCYATVALALALESPHIDLRGMHCHIGSQIFQAQGFAQAAQTVLTYMQEVNQRFGLSLPEIDLGGGYGIAYIPGQEPRSPSQIAQELAAAVAQTCSKLNMAIPHLSFEPGRAISGPAGLTLYTVGTIKDVSVQDQNQQVRIRRYVSVDGGMSDNARPVLYEADYTAVLANRQPSADQLLCRVVGKHCESGDIVVRYVYLPRDLQAGDILAVPATGAYCFSLSSNYNYLTRPPVVATATGQKAQLIVRAETEEDMLARDLG